MDVKAYAIKSKGQKLEPTMIDRREPGAEDVLIALQYCGICHSDLTVVDMPGGTA